MDTKSLLKKASNTVIGTYPTAGAMSIGAAVEHLLSGGKLEDIPEKMRDAVIQHLSESAPSTTNERDIQELGSGLAAISNVPSAVGHAVDFAASLAKPESEEERSRKAVRKELGITDEEESVSREIAQGGLKKRLMKGGAQADFARLDSMQRGAASRALDTSNVSPLRGKKQSTPLPEEPPMSQLKEDQAALEAMGMRSGVESEKPKTETAAALKKQPNPDVEKEVKPKALTKKQIAILEDSADRNFVYGLAWNPEQNFNIYGGQRRSIKDLVSRSEFESIRRGVPVTKYGYTIELVPVEIYGNNQKAPPIGYEYERSSFIRVRKTTP